MRRKELLGCLLSLILMIIAVMGYGSPASSQKTSQEKWVIGVSYDPTTTPDPHTPYMGTAVRHLHNLVYECLWGWQSITQPDGTVRFIDWPQLATSWEWTDSTHARFHLRKGVKFQNGETFSAEDVKYSFDFVVNNPKTRSHKYLKNIQECRIIDPYTVEFVMPKADPRIIEHLQWMFIVPKSRGTDEKPSESFSKNPVGTGFYKIIKWERDKPIELEAWRNFRDGMMRPRYLTIKYIPDPTTRLAALIAGEVDMIMAPAPAHLKLIRAHKDLTLATLKGGRQICYQYQFLKPPYNDPRVRQALLYAVDRKAIVDKILEGNAIIIPSYLWGPWEGAIPEQKLYPYDPKKAKELLAEAGYPNGFELTLDSPSGEFMKDKEIAEAMQGYWAAIGVKCNLRFGEMAKEYEIFYSGKFDVIHTYWGLVAYTPATPLEWALVWGFPEDKISGGVVPSDAAQIRDLMKKAGVELDKAKRAAIYQQINKIMYDNSVIYPSHAEDVNTAYNKTKIGPWERVFFRGYADYELFCDFRHMYPAK